MTWDDVIEYEKRESFEAGHEAGLEEGLQAGMETGINNFIAACRKMNQSDNDIINLLMDEFSLTKEIAIAKVTNN